MGITLNKLVVTIAIFVFAIATLGPALYQYGSPSFANNINSTGIQTYNGLNITVFNPIHSATFNTSGATGFNVALQNSFGYAFVLGGMFQIMTSLTNIPNILSTILTQVTVQLGLPIQIAAIGSGLLVSFLVFVITMIGVSMWMKYDARNG